MPNTGIYAAASAMLTDSRSVDVISHNIANANTPGYKKATALKGSFSQQLNMAEMRNGEIDRDSGVFFEGTARNFLNGDRVHTGETYDLALEGEGFYLVNKDGKELLTRDSHFQLNNTGELVTVDGWKVNGQGGTISVPQEAYGVEVDTQGRIHALIPTEEGDIRTFVDQLRVATVEDKSKLRAYNGQYFYKDNHELLDTEKYMVYQGNIEESNLNPVEEMVEMIAAQRRYEGAQKALKIQIDIGEKYSSILGGVS